MASTSDEYDETDDIQSISNNPLTAQDQAAAERIIRKRSSKACDNCRKAKCKCDRTPQQAASGESCRNCILLGQECTFLGPSRKRGPPKGYIDALETKLHQLEALLGTIITSKDPRAQTLVQDLIQDNLARQVITRVDEQSPFGTRGRKQAAANRELYGRSALPQPNSRRRDSTKSVSGNASAADSDARSGFNGPPHEWQDSLSDLIDAKAHERALVHGPSISHPSASAAGTSSRSSFTDANSSVRLPSMDFSTTYPLSEDSKPPFPSYAPDASNPHQRRRLDDMSPPLGFLAGPIPSKTSQSTLPPLLVKRSTHQLRASDIHSTTSPALRHSTSFAQTADSESDSDLADAVGQLSINELKQVRYHGKASGLQFLMPAMDVVHEGDGLRPLSGSVGDQFGRPSVTGGIWEFPGVWPPNSYVKGERPQSSVGAHLSRMNQDYSLDSTLSLYLPDRALQEHLLGLYFAYVHPVIPILLKTQFSADWKARNDPGHPNRAEAMRRIPNVLLLAMFSIAARYSADTPFPEEGNIWNAGDQYFDRAREVLLSFFSLSRPDIVQALLLMGYREIGLGTMAQAWLWVGIAIRAAQDVGLHRSIDMWQPAGQQKFTREEKETRCRIWHACMRLDKYVSTYIGRPLTVYEHDYDTPLPAEDEMEEMEPWIPFHSMPGADTQAEDLKIVRPYQPGRTIACFNASITLSMLLGSIVFTLYAIRPPSPSLRRRERLAIEQKLDRWLIDLPEPLKLNLSHVISPHILTLHLQYWTTVLLLNRPFIRVQERSHSSPSSQSSSEREDAVSVAAQAFTTCQKAAQQITNIATTYNEVFSMRRSPAIFSYYVFSAAIMHVTSLLEHPGDPQASIALQKTMDALKPLSVIWPSAGRALVLLRNVKSDLRRSELSTLTNAPERRKRLASEPDALSQILDGMSPLHQVSIRQSSLSSSSRSTSSGPSHIPPLVSSSRTPHTSSFPLPTPSNRFPTGSGLDLPGFDLTSGLHGGPAFQAESSYARWSAQTSAASHLPSLTSLPNISSVSRMDYGAPRPADPYGYSARPTPYDPIQRASMLEQSRFSQGQQQHQPGTNYWSELQSNDPFGDPSLLSTLHSLGSTSNSGNTGQQEASGAGPLHAQQHGSMPSGFDALFGGNSSTNDFFESRRSS